MSSKLPKQFLDEMFLRRLDRMKIDPDQTIPEDIFEDTLVEDDNTLTDEKTLKFFQRTTYYMSFLDALVPVMLFYIVSCICIAYALDM